MNLGKDKNGVLDGVCQSCQVLSRLSFREAVQMARDQIEFDCIEHFLDEANELCMIIAEIWMLDPADKIRIAGEVLDAYLVGEVFKEVRCEHVQMVIRNFHGINYLVQNKKSYLRTALYNSVFEMSAHYSNQIAKKKG